MKTTDDIMACLAVVALVGECIRDATETSPLKGIPSGHLYAALMAKGLSYESYTLIIKKLTDCKLVKESNHLLSWIGDESVVVSVPIKQSDAESLAKAQADQASRN